MSFLSAGERAAVTGKARVFRGRLLVPDDYLHLLKCGTVGEVIMYLGRTPSYSSYFHGEYSEAIHRGEIEGILSIVPMLEELPFCRYLGPERASLLHAWGERFDLEVVKRVLRIIATGMGDREALRRRVSSVPITLADAKKLLAAQTFRDVIEAIKGYPLENVLTEPLRQASETYSGGSVNLFRAKMAMDAFFMTRILSAGEKLPGSEGKGIRSIFGTRADLINLYWIYRGRRFFAMTPEEALAITLPVRYTLNFETLRSFAFAPDIPAMLRLIQECPYGAAFTTALGESTLEVSEIILEHNLYRILWRAATKIFASGTSGVHVVLAYLILRELEVKDLFTIIEDIRYDYDKKRAREFLIHPGANAFTSGDRGMSWQ